MAPVMLRSRARRGPRLERRTTVMGTTVTAEARSGNHARTPSPRLLSSRWMGGHHDDTFWSFTRRVSAPPFSCRGAGSKFLVEAEGRRLLVDCGLYQGLKELRLRNWEPLPVDPASVDWVVLTHGHIDHTGYLPRLISDGFNGPVYGTWATADLLKILLPDSGHLQEEETEYHDKRSTRPRRGSKPPSWWGSDTANRSS